MLRPMRWIHQWVNHRTGLALGCCLVVVGCQDATQPQFVGDHATLRPQLGRSAVAYESLDEEFGRLASEVPGGFAGIYFDSAGELVVGLTDVSQRDEALDRLKETLRLHTLGRSSPDVTSRVRVRLASYPFNDLKKWREHIESRWGALPGLVMTDINEVSNQIDLGFKDPSIAQSALSKVLREAGIPSAAVRSVVSQEAQVTQTLDDFFATLPGGVHAYAVGSGGGPCSVGINVLYNGVSAFITASHCTLTQGFLDGGPWGHAGSSNLGTEIADPGSICPVYVFTYPCRRSDAAVIQYSGANPGELGMIARTEFFGAYPPGGPGSETIDVVKPRFPLVWPGYPTSNPLMNEQVDKVGRGTGWIRGPINQTCVTHRQNTGWYMFCTYRFNGVAEGGDSGAPIFHRITCPGESWPAVNCASFAGIQWGITAGQVYFSTTNNIFQDFSSASFVFVN